MSRPPSFEPRRQREIEAELVARAKVWLPEWQTRVAQGDFASALFRIAARLSSEVAQRLDRVPEKSYRGFLHWLGLRGDAGRAARIPVVLKLSAGADAVRADPPVQFQALGVDPPVMFETIESLQVCPGEVASLVAVDPAKDQYYLPPSVFNSLEPPDPLAEESKVFDPFGAEDVKSQSHALYIGATDALNIEAPALIRLHGAAQLQGYEWHYWGSANGADAAWNSFTSARAEGDALILEKPEASLEVTKVEEEYESRWLRATPKDGQSVTRSEQTGEAIRLSINCGSEPPDVVDAEAVANTTPIVLNAGFYPLGRVPRMFDAFYVSSKEALSKPQARVKLHFELGDQFGAPIVLLEKSGSAEHRVFGLTLDGKLRRAVNPATASGGELAVLSTEQPKDTSDQPVALRSNVMPGYAASPTTAYVIAVGAAEVRLWTEAFAQRGGNWSSLGFPSGASDSDPDEKIQTVLTPLSDNVGGFELYAYIVVQGTLYRRNALRVDPWVAVVEDTDVACVVPLHPDEDDLLIVSRPGDLYSYRQGSGLTAIDVPIPIDPDFYPSVRVEDELIRCVAKQKDSGLIAFALDDPDTVLLAELSHPVVGASVCFSNQDRSAGLVLFPVRVDETIRIAVWEPFATDPVGVEILDEPRSNPALAGAPVQTRGFEIFPAQNGDLCVTSLFAGEVTSIPEAALNQAALLEGDTTAFADASFIDWKVSSSTARHIDKTKHFDAANGDSVFIGESPKVTASATSVTMYRKLEDSHEGHRQSNSDHVLQLASDDEETKEDQLLIVEWGKERRLYTVETVDRTDPTNYIAKVTERIPQAAGTVMYQAVEPCFDGDVRSYPAVDISKVPLSVRQAISSGSLTVDDFEPQRQRGINLEIDGAWTLLSEPWSAKVDPVANAYAVIVQSAAPQWRIYSPMRARNPALSWEYWNGSNWWRIDGLDDTTLDLQQSGDVQFCVPADLKPTDVVGRSNHWIRARLVGGDYGDEKVTIVSETTGNKTTQTIDRSTDNVTAPYVAKFSLSYFVCCLVAPDFIVTKDGGNVLNQSAANQTEDATITAFTPLADFLPDAETAIYLGFDAPIVGGPISVLFKVDERPHDDAFPLRLDVLRRERFEPVICEDNTRGLGETGTLRFNLTTRPELREYFGAKRYWMRVRPREGADLTRWKPAIRAAYLNAVYASAAETQSNEILGSSDGRPDLTARLSRTPVIAGSLKLRVRERLATDEVDALNEAAADTVLTAIPNREGTWVLWKEVPDLLDARPGERIYTLDEDGEIQFGDGLRGMIPPPGVDCILAQGYQRGGGKAANEVRAFSQANLVTSLQGVELAVFVDRAAGGTDSQDIDSTLRFAPAKLRQRNRILTLEDLETSALEFSSDVAQSLALSTSRGVDVYLVMKGGEPLPSAAVRREFQRYVTERVSPDLAAHGVVSAKSPPKVYLRLEIRALIANIDAAGQVASRCKEKIAALLDPVVGGWEGSGWPLGAVPDRADIAACLDDIEHLDELLDFDMAWVAKPGETPNASTAPKLTPQSLILLDTDGFKVVVSISDAEVSA